MERPTTSNPKRQTFASHHGTEQSSFHVEPTPVKNNTGMQLDPSVIWSAQEGGVPENMLARPHTSNPRYVEKSQRDASPCTKSNVSIGFNFSPVSASSRNNNPTTNGGTTASLTNPSSNGPTPITTGRVHCPDDAASPCFADDGNSSPQHHRVVYEEGPNVGVLWASDSYSVDPQLLARPVTSNPWLQRVFDSVEPLEGDGESPYETPVPALTKQRHSQILWSSADVNDWRMLARPHTSNPLLEQMDRGPGVEKSGKVQGTKILWRREETVEEMQEIIAAQETRIRHLESAVLQLRTQLSAQDGDHVDHMYIPRQPITPTDSGANKARKVSGAYFPETNDGDDHQLLSDNLSGTGRPDIMNMDEASNVLSFESNETPSRILSQPSPIKEVEEDCPSPIQQVRPVSSCSQHQRAPVQLSDAETERFIRNNVTLAGGEDAVDEYNRMKKDLRNEARFKSTSQPHDDASPADTIPFRPPSRPESALPSRRAARLRQTVTQCRPNTAAASRRPVVATTEIATPPTDKPARPMSARPMTTSSWQSHPSHNVGEPVSLRAFLQNQANPCFTKLNAHPTLSATKAVGFLSDAAYAQEYAKLVRKGESYVLKDDFKELYLERAEEFGVTVSDREVERKMERFDSAGVDYLSPEEFAILYLKVAQW